MTGDKEKIVYLNKSGKRLDGRKIDEFRPITAEVGVLSKADGSAYLEWGQNKVFVGVYGPKECIPKHSANPYKAVLKVNYRMATFSVNGKKSPRPGRREIEISKVTKEALERVVILEKFPNAAIEITIEIVDSNAGTRIAGLTAAALALADAGIPMRDLVSGVSVGRVDGNIMLDLTKEEEDAHDAVDIPIAFAPNSKEVVLLQLDGLLSKEEWKKSLDLAKASVDKVYEVQKNALKKKYAMEAEKK